MTHSGWGEGWAEVHTPVAPERARLRRPESPAKRLRRRKRRRVVLLAGLGLVLVLACLGGYLALNVLRARDALNEAAAALPGLEQQLRTDPEAAAPALANLQNATGRAAAASSGPIWSLGAHVPVVGPNLRAVSVVARTVDRLAQDVLPRVSEVVAAVNPATLAPVDGRVDLLPLQQASGEVLAADAAVRSAIVTMSGIERAGLIDQVGSAVDALQTELVALSSTTATAARAVQLLPSMLGAQGPRDWLVLAQNNAEQRALGGIPGVVLLMRANDGKVSLERTASTSDFPKLTEPILPLTAEELELYGQHPGLWLQNVTMTPDFPRAAQLARAMWLEVLGGGEPGGPAAAPQGVLSLDPVGLGRILAVTGPVSFTDPHGELVELSEQNTAEFLMSELYDRYPDPRVQDEVYAEASAAIFERLLRGGLDANALIATLDELAVAGRLLVWSALPEEQELLADTVLSGRLRGTAPTPDGLIAPVAGVFLNLTTGSKLGYYLHTEASVAQDEMRPDGSQTFELRVRLTNTLTAERAAELPDYVVGSGPRDGSVSTNVAVYAPTGGGIRSTRDGSGAALPIAARWHDGLSLGSVHVDLAAGQTLDLVFDLVSGPGQPGKVQVRLTPGP